MTAPPGMTEAQKLRIVLADEEARHAETKAELARAWSVCERLKSQERRP